MISLEYALVALIAIAFALTLWWLWRHPVGLATCQWHRCGRTYVVAESDADNPEAFCSADPCEDEYLTLQHRAAANGRAADANHLAYAENNAHVDYEAGE